MVFSSVTFLFYFLPAFLISYFAMPGVRTKNLVLLAFSLVFYAWGGLANVAVLAVSIVANYGFALLIDRQQPRGRLRMLGLAVAANLAGLIAFKYAGFLAENLNILLEPTGLSLPVVHLALPLGISFFTFHAISYLVDVYRRKARANGRFEEIAVYITMFPQLVAGPIVRYSTIAHRIRNRRTTLGRVSAGLRIFVIGLSWKVLIADQVAPIVAAVFDETAVPNLAEAWLGVTAYALQIYFDFGGYSNMAIGLALAMGLKFPRNFDLPYGALSITDFWRRWHMSLSAFLRDYLYIPLGGNRGGEMRTYINLSIVFLLCGLWHGASWTFVIWGAHHGAFLIIERAFLGRWLKRMPGPVSHLYTVLVVMIGWVWFRADSLPGAIDMFQGLAGLNGFSRASMALGFGLTPLAIMALVAGGLIGFFRWPRWKIVSGEGAMARVADFALIAVLMLASVAWVGGTNGTPFLYYRF